MSQALAGIRYEKKTPFRSRPMTAKIEFEVSAASDR
jgi:hypothetical protein